MSVKKLGATGETSPTLRIYAALTGFRDLGPLTVEIDYARMARLPEDCVVGDQST